MRFPFGEPVQDVKQAPLQNADFFFLGVYASAVHARWYSPKGELLVKAFAVASEPNIFWTGEDAAAIIARIKVPTEAGFLVPAEEKYNGPSGRTLDSHYLAPLKTSRANSWLCDLLPTSRVNEGQEKAIARHYRNFVKRGVVTESDCPPVPKRFADENRRTAILKEFLRSGANTLVTLGDAPLKEFVRPLEIGMGRLADYGKTPKAYGQRHDAILDGHHFQLLPLVHPRQAGRLGRSSGDWTSLHLEWMGRQARSAS